MGSNQKPDTALLFCVLGGFFTILQGAAYVFGGLDCVSNGPAPVSPSLCHAAVVVSTVGVVGGFAILACGVGLSRWPRYHVLLGALATAGALLGFPALVFVGGGQFPFVLGPLIGTIGGILAAVWKPSPGVGSPFGTPAPPA
jgi:hypothetical protein